MRPSAFPRASKPERDKLLEKVIADNTQFTNLKQQLDCMVPFAITRAAGIKTDIFNHKPKTGKMAVGYRAVFKAGHWTVEPWAWLVDDEQHLTGIELNELVPSAIYMGVVVQPELVKKYGTNAYSLLLGNLRMLQTYRSHLVSY